MRTPDLTTSTLRAPWRAVLLCSASFVSSIALAQPTTPATLSLQGAVTGNAVQPQVNSSAGKPWKSLDAAQQTALAPLALTWETLNSGQKNKWLELSKNYASLPAAEQAKLKNRMADWAKLSTQQRAQARHNFAVNQAITSGLNSDQRSAQWQAYQLLSPKEKQALAAQSGKDRVATAANPRPSEPLKNTPAPQFGTAKALAAQPAGSTLASSKIAVAPHLQTGNSLMPKSALPKADAPQAATPGSAAPAAR